MTPKTFTLSMTIGLSEARLMVKALEALEPKTSSQEWSRRDLIMLINHQINKASGGEDGKHNSERAQVLYMPYTSRHT